MRLKWRQRRPSERRLLMIVHSEYPIGETRVRRQAEAACRAGWQVDVLALATDGAPRHELMNGVRVFRTPVRRVRRMTPWGLVSEYGRFWLAAAAFCFKASAYRTVVVANPPDFLVFAAIVQRLRGASITLDIHDLMTDLFAVRLARGMDSVEMRMLVALERISWRFADRLMTVHEPYRREILRRFEGQHGVAVVMNSADPQLFKQRSSSPVAPKVVGYHGSIFERYGVFDVLHAFVAISERFPDAELWMLGDGDARQALESEAELLGVAERCRFSPGFVSSEEIAELLPKFSVGVVPNRPNVLNRFALSTKLFEYVVVGVPVVCVELETLAAHFGLHEVLFYEPESVEDLAAKLTECLLHPRESEAMARRASEHYRNDYSWERNSEVFLKEIDA